MDLLGDLGQEDQLISTRAENKVLQEKVKELTLRVHALKCENEALKAEVEIYRGDANFLISTGDSSNVFGESKEVDYGADHFVTSGDGIYPSDAAVTLPNIHGNANPLCCALHLDDALLATGGADSNLKLCRWGIALAPGDESSVKAVADSITIPCGAPVICCSFAQVGQGKRLAVVGAGCMDGSVKLSYGASLDDLDQTINSVDRLLKSDNDIKHKKYVKTICWSPTESILASASADGTIQLTKIGFVDKEKSTVSLEVLKSMHFDCAVESMCFVNGNTLCCYVRGTSYLSYFDLKDNYKQTKVSLNGSAGTECFDEHVSFAVLSLTPSPCGSYIALATDAGRNIIMESTDKIVRNLYGHKNDGFSTPKIAWSKSGQYLYGNSQDTKHLIVWDIASESIVKELDAGGFVRDMYSSRNSDTLVSVSFDKTAKIWLRDM